ncbi:MAG: ASKHA domain-containing protein [Sphaerochaeta sp.]|nr:ASKHA domain-containing protein [Sphaerochaeta sp.]
MAPGGTLTVVAEDRVWKLTGVGGRTVLELLVDAGIEGYASPCGGNGLCGKCLVKITEGEAGGVHADERRLLTPAQLQDGLRLACRMRYDGDADLTITLLDASARGNILTTFNNEMPCGTPRRHYHAETYGCAIDIGTTTIVVYLVRLDTRQVIGHRSAMNRQRSHGADVISRIQYAQEHPDGTRILQHAIVGQLDAMIGDLLTSHGIPSEAISELVAVGNPTMIHLLVGADTSGIGAAPFTCAFTEPRSLRGVDIGLDNARHAHLELPGAVAAYVGSDITSGVHAANIMRSGKPVLYIDIGTNGEIVLWDGKRLSACASAAGPAFEGASIRHGLGAVPGAIDHIWHHPDGRIAWSTIGAQDAHGICGSGIVDTMALLLDLGLVDETGAMDTSHPNADRYLTDSPDGLALRITDTIHFTRTDVREVQLAKAAIAAGAQVLLDAAGLASDELEGIVIAGGFGSYIDIASAQRIGLLPPVSPFRISVVGNAAGKGALEQLMFDGVTAQVEQIRTAITYIELSSSSAFQQQYVSHMYFGEDPDA